LLRCPLKLVTKTTGEWISLYQHYRRGFLLVNGGLLAQPYKYLQAMRVIEGEIERHFKDMAKKVG
jgi:hypothetical protein